MYYLYNVWISSTLYIDFIVFTVYMILHSACTVGMVSVVWILLAYIVHAVFCL